MAGNARPTQLLTAHGSLLTPKTLALLDQGLQFGQGGSGADGLPGQFDAPEKIRGQPRGDEGRRGI